MQKIITAKAIIEVKNLQKQYGDLVAVNNISFEIRQGCCFGLLGPNGAGKTTSIEMMEGITEPSKGEIKYKGNSLDKRFRNECGIQFQHTALQEFLSVKETLELFKDLYPQSEDLQKVIELCHLQEFLHHNNQKLSGGQRQRMLLAIALINKPEIIFLDEPTTGLDPQARHNFWRLIELILERGTTVILSTHYMEEAAQLCDEIIIMDHGKIIAQGEPSHLLRHHFNEQLVKLPKSLFSSSMLQELSSQEKIIELTDVVEISTSDVNQTLQRLMNLQIDLNQLQVRQRNLEDLFLELTGKELRI